MGKQVLSIEQMLHLQELGVDTSKASMVLIYKDEEGNEVEWEDINDFEDGEIFAELLHAETGDYDHSYRRCCGVFTLQDVLDLLPKEIEIEIFIHKWFFNIDYQRLDMTYSYTAENGASWNIKSISIKDVLLIDAAYEMLCWCAENGYVETQKK